jgi:hypothetical protein
MNVLRNTAALGMAKTGLPVNVSVQVWLSSLSVAATIRGRASATFLSNVASSSCRDFAIYGCWPGRMSRPSVVSVVVA